MTGCGGWGCVIYLFVMKMMDKVGFHRQRGSIAGQVASSASTVKNPIRSSSPRPLIFPSNLNPEPRTSLPVAVSLPPPLNGPSVEDG